MRVFGERLGKLWTDFRFETFVLSVSTVEALDSKQLSFTCTEPVEDEASFDALVDRLGMKLGFDNVNRIRVRESLLPEHSIELQPASADMMTGAEWPEYRLRPTAAATGKLPD